LVHGTGSTSVYIKNTYPDGTAWWLFLAADGQWSPALTDSSEVETCAELGNASSARVVRNDGGDVVTIHHCHVILDDVLTEHYGVDDKLTAFELRIELAGSSLIGTGEQPAAELERFDYFLGFGDDPDDLADGGLLEVVDPVEQALVEVPSDVEGAVMVEDMAWGGALQSEDLPRITIGVSWNFEEDTEVRL
jgi:hypothetical protein